VPGHVWEVRPNGFDHGQHTMGQFLTIECAGLPEAQADAIYMTDGIPAAVREAEADADVALDVAAKALQMTWTSARTRRRRRRRTTRLWRRTRQRQPRRTRRRGRSACA